MTVEDALLAMWYDDPLTFVDENTAKLEAALRAAYFQGGYDRMESVAVRDMNSEHGVTAGIAELGQAT